jgi:hypothetical protein
MSIEVTGLTELIADFAAAQAKVMVNGKKAVQVTSMRIKKAWAQADSGLAHAPAYPRSIGYDVRTGAGWVEGTIGPDKDKAQGALGNLIEFGSVNNPPRGSGARALAENTDDLVRGVELAVRSAL